MWPWTRWLIGRNTEALLANTAALKENTLELKLLGPSVRQNSVALARLTVSVERLIKLLKRPPNPGPITLRPLSEENDMIQFDIDLPVDAGTAEVVGGKLTYSIGVGNTPTVVTTAKGQLAVSGLEGPQDAQVDASFVFVDDAGNDSATPATLSVTLKDTFPPENPGALGLRVTGETP